MLDLSLVFTLLSDVSITNELFHRPLLFHSLGASQSAIVVIRDCARDLLGVSLAIGLVALEFLKEVQVVNYCGAVERAVIESVMGH